MIERTRKILMSIIKHCSSITETKKHFGNEYKKFENNIEHCKEKKDEKLLYI